MIELHYQLEQFKNTIWFFFLLILKTWAGWEVSKIYTATGFSMYTWHKTNGFLHATSNLPSKVSYFQIL